MAQDEMMSPTTRQYIIGTIVGSAALGGASRFRNGYAMLWVVLVMFVGALVSYAVSRE